MNKLLEKGYVDCIVDGKRKLYFITPKGRTGFTEWITNPMNPEKARNIEASKMFFMGMVEKDNVPEPINNYISTLKQELELMTKLLNISLSNREQLIQQSGEVITQDKYNSEGIKKLSGRSIGQMIEDIYFYQVEILRYGVDSLEFEIKWYEDFLKRVLERG